MITTVRPFRAFRSRPIRTCKGRASRGESVMSKQKLRRGERVAKVKSVGKATPAGINIQMPGTATARGQFVAVPKKPKAKKKRTKGAV